LNADYRVSDCRTDYVVAGRYQSCKLARDLRQQQLKATVLINFLMSGDIAEWKKTDEQMTEQVVH
jgi:hypothetical protein